MKKIIILLCVSFLLYELAYSQTGNIEAKIFKIRHGNLETMQDLANNLKSPEGKVSVDHNTDSLIVVDHPEVLMRISSVIDQLDVPQKQVEIKVLVTELTEKIMKDIGLSALQVIIPSGQSSGILDLLHSSQESTIRSEMTLRTLSNQPASLQVSKDEVFGTTLTRYADGSEVTSVVREQVGDFLQVLPTVNNDGTVTIALMPSVSSLESNGIPRERTILTQVVINNKDTIVLGGVTEAKTETGKSLFFAAENGESRKVMMFLTATIIE